MPNTLYKTVAPVVTFFTSGPTAETSPAKINHREVSIHRSMRARGQGVACSVPARAQTLKPPPPDGQEGKGVHRASILSRTARGFTLRALREHDPALGHRFRGRHLDENAGAARDDRGVLGRHLEQGGRALRGRRATRARWRRDGR